MVTQSATALSGRLYWGLCTCRRKCGYAAQPQGNQSISVEKWTFDTQLLCEFLYTLAIRVWHLTREDPTYSKYLLETGQEGSKIQQDDKEISTWTPWLVYTVTCHRDFKKGVPCALQYITLCRGHMHITGSCALTLHQHATGVWVCITRTCYMNVTNVSRVPL